MQGLMRALLIVAPIVIVQTLAGCESTPPVVQPNWVMTPISDFKNIAGKWQGMMVEHPHPPRGAGDWVRVAITEDGRYQFSSYRGVGVFSGSGTMTLSDGKAYTKTDRGNSVSTLHTADGRRMLRVSAKTTDGMEYSADLEPAK